MGWREREARPEAGVQTCVLVSARENAVAVTTLFIILPLALVSPTPRKRHHSLPMACVLEPHSCCAKYFSYNERGTAQRKRKGDACIFVAVAVHHCALPVALVVRPGTVVNAPNSISVHQRVLYTQNGLCAHQHNIILSYSNKSSTTLSTYCCLPCPCRRSFSHSPS
jgi:hypothetical protein